ncbi:MAG: hypothetical protein VYD87_05195 [Pseudomonadota bacterium]|nr:hypothetical protein [Pseudomonadota bacterium]
MSRVFRPSPLEPGKIGPRPAREPGSESGAGAGSGVTGGGVSASRPLGGASGAGLLKPRPMQPGRRSAAASAAFEAPARAPRPPASSGHNQGPPLTGGFALFAWRKAQAEAWKPPHPEVLRRRLKYAAECGLTYREYTLEIMERGRWLTPEKDAARIARIIAERG